MFFFSLVRMSFHKIVLLTLFISIVIGGDIMYNDEEKRKFDLLLVELQTKLREDFTITEKAPPGPFDLCVGVPILHPLSVGLRSRGLLSDCEIFAKVRFQLYSTPQKKPLRPRCPLLCWAWSCHLSNEDTRTPGELSSTSSLYITGDRGNANALIIIVIIRPP